MAVVVGERDSFALVVGAPDPSDLMLRRVDIWVAGQSICSDDNVVYVPSFRLLLENESNDLAKRDLTSPDGTRTAIDAHRWCQRSRGDRHERYQFMCWGPTTDNFSSYIFAIENSAAITAQFWRRHVSRAARSKILVGTLSTSSLQRILREAAESLTG